MSPIQPVGASDTNGDRRIPFKRSPGRSWRLRSPSPKAPRAPGDGAKREATASTDDGDARTAQQGHEKPSGWYTPHRAIVILGTSLIAVAIAGGTLGVVNSTRAEQAMATLSDRYLVLQPPVREMRAGVADFQVLAEQAFVDSSSDSTLLASAEVDSNATDSNYLTLQRLLALPGNANLAPHLSTQMAAYVAAPFGSWRFPGGRKARPADRAPRRRGTERRCKPRRRLSAVAIEREWSPGADR